jgi:molybdopterin synthase catalytic subunit
MSFLIQSTPLDPEAIRGSVQDPAAGGFCSFEGWVRNHHEGRSVDHLEYEAYVPLAEKEGDRILAEAAERFGILHAACVHRTGPIEIGGLAVAVSVSAVHRDAAFDACRYIIDEVKSRVPIWKKEHFTDGTSGWVRCDHCAGHHHH